MPEYLPDRLEAGTHNLPGIAGLLAGLRYVTARTPETIGRREGALIRRAAQGLARLPHVKAFQARDPACQSGVLSFQVEGMDCEAVGESLSRRGIAVRTGLHCAPLAHRTAGTLETGTLRASVSAFTTPREVQEFLRTLGMLLRT